MKTIITVFLVFLSAILTAQDFEIRAVNKGSGVLGIEMRETSGIGTPTTGNFVLDGVFGIRWDASYGINLGNPSGNFNVTKTGTETTKIGYEFQAYYMNSTPFNFPANWTQNIWVEVASVSVSQIGVGTGTFEICPNSFDASTNLNFNVDATDYTPVINGSAANVALGTAITWIGTTADWSIGSNWTGGNIPTQYQGTSIPTSPTGGNFPALSANTTIKNLEIATSARVEIGTNTFTVSGEISGAGVIRGSSTSNLSLTNSTASTLNMDQTTPGTTNMLQNLTVNGTGGITLGNALEIIGVLTPTAGTITTGGNLTLAATATGTYAQIDPSGTGTFSGNIKMEKFLTNTNAGWRQYSLPLVGTLANISDMDLLYASHGTANEKNAFYWDATDNAGNATGWTAASSTDNQTRGYSIYSNTGSGGLHDISQTISNTGTYDKTNRDYAIKATVDPASSGASATGWNLIGNPYPSNLDLTAMFTGWPGTVSYKAVHVWDATAGQYKAILGSGATIQNYNTSGGSVSSTVLAPFQAFWVKANSDVTFTVNNADRTTSATGLGTFMKNGLDLARLNVLDKNNKWDQTAIYFESAATAGFDPSYDGYKLISMNADVPSLYAVNQDGIFSISALDADEHQHTVPLGFRSTTKGEMTFELNTDELDQKWYVYLEDKELGIFYNIKENAYTFNHTHNSDSRFVLHFQTYALSADMVVEDVQKLKIGGDGDAVYVFVPAHYQNQVYNIEVLDFAGQNVYNKKQELNYGMNTLNFNLNNSAYYIFRITAAEGMVSEKVFLR